MGGIGLLIHWHPNWSNLKLPTVGHIRGENMTFPVTTSSHLHIPPGNLTGPLPGGQKEVVGGSVVGALILTQPYTTRSSS